MEVGGHLLDPGNCFWRLYLGRQHWRKHLSLLNHLLGPSFSFLFGPGVIGTLYNLGTMYCSRYPSMSLWNLIYFVCFTCDLSRLMLCVVSTQGNHQVL